MKKKKWFSVYIKSQSMERYDVEAENEDEAYRLYKEGKASFEGDEPISSYFDSIEERQ